MNINFFFLLISLFVYLLFILFHILLYTEVKFLARDGPLSIFKTGICGTILKRSIPTLNWIECLNLYPKKAHQTSNPVEIQLNNIHKDVYQTA